MQNLLGNKYKILERKVSKFGVVGYVDKQSGLDKQWTGKPIAYYDDMKRKDAYITCRDRYLHDQIARPIINTIVHAIFSKPPDFEGDEKLVKRARKIVRDSEISWTTWGADLDVYGDAFIRSFLGKNAKIASIPPESIDIIYDQNNVLNIKDYRQFADETGNGDSISPDEMTHLKINDTTDTVYGSGTLRPALYWLDVLDNLWERNVLRAAQYFGYPLIAVLGIPGEHQTNVQTSLQTDGQRPGRIWTFGEGVTIDVPDMRKGFDIIPLIDRVYQYILAACGVPQHLIYESNSSRGVAMFSADGFEMMIKARRHVWTLGLVKAMRIIFEDEGLWKDDSKFGINWAPVFLRDLKNLAAMIDMALGNKLASKKTARELIGLDHSKEEENIEDEPEEEIVPSQVAPAAQNQGGKQIPAKPGRRGNQRL